jgi:2-polyprenyl-6-methoxyphenol hydroxylase-like FAD-dependent oxidoreductase
MIYANVKRPVKVAIAGGGIGGLAAALFLHGRGIEVDVYESVAEIHELGVGINLQPHAVRELERIGLRAELEAAGNSCDEWAMFNRFGQEIWREPRGRAAGHAWPQISVHRGRLQGILLAAARARLGAARIHTDHHLLDFADGADGITARFATGEGRGPIVAVTADALIGADGIHSTVRRILYPAEGDPVFAGMLLWRGMTRTKSIFGGHTMSFAGYREQKFISYPITGPDADGCQMLNWIAEIHADKMLRREDWNRHGQLEEFLPAYEDWKFPWADIPQIIRDADRVYEYPMIDRDPLPRWTFGRVTLLGDAAHAMYPIGANGASQAIRDGAALADALAESGSAAEGLQRYEAARRETTNQIVISNRQLGPEQVMQIAHERAPNGFEHIEDVISREELVSIAQRYRSVTWASGSVNAA